MAKKYGGKKYTSPKFGRPRSILFSAINQGFDYVRNPSIWNVGGLANFAGRTVNAISSYYHDGVNSKINKALGGLSNPSAPISSVGAGLSSFGQNVSSNISSSLASTQNWTTAQNVARVQSFGVTFSPNAGSGLNSAQYANKLTPNLVQNFSNVAQVASQVGGGTAKIVDDILKDTASARKLLNGLSWLTATVGVGLQIGVEGAHFFYNAFRHQQDEHDAGFDAASSRFGFGNAGRFQSISSEAKKLTRWDLNDGVATPYERIKSWAGFGEQESNEATMIMNLRNVYTSGRSRPFETGYSIAHEARRQGITPDFLERIGGANEAMDKVTEGVINKLRTSPKLSKAARRIYNKENAIQFTDPEGVRPYSQPGDGNSWAEQWARNQYDAEKRNLDTVKERVLSDFLTKDIEDPDLGPSFLMQDRLRKESIATYWKNQTPEMKQAFQTQQRDATLHYRAEVHRKSVGY